MARMGGCARCCRAPRSGGDVVVARGSIKSAESDLVAVDLPGLHSDQHLAGVYSEVGS